jgi:superfamily II DNA or RNA helicase/HKD family nuclease
VLNECPLCAAPLVQIVAADDLTIVVTTANGLWLAPRRHASRWRDLSPEERAALGERIGSCQGRVEAAGRRTTVTFCESDAHFHIRISLEELPDTAFTATTHQRALIAGSDDPLYRHLVPHIDAATAVDVVVAFVLSAGVEMIAPHLQDLLDRGGRLRLVTGDYLDVTDPVALRRLLDLVGDRDLRVFQASRQSFHAKSWLFGFDGSGGGIIVGSSNLSATALTSGIEWNLRLFADVEAPPLVEARAAFEALFQHPATAPLTDDWIDAYAARRERAERRSAVETGVADEPAPPPPEPHSVQREALAALSASRLAGYKAGLVVLATGLGKTFLAAFDSRDHRRVLFVAHRDEILTQAMSAFRRVRPTARLGRFTGAEKDRDADVVFASVQTLGRAAHLEGFDRGAFDYVVVDEFHHASARTYRAIIDHFEPRFLLGLTATPDRMDRGDLLGLCQENLVYRCDLWEGVTRGLLSPFRYWGVPDPVEYAQIPWRNGRFDETELTAAVATEARAENALDQLRRRGGARALGFCVSVRHADFMANFAKARGLRAVAVHSGPGSAPRASALEALAEGSLDIVFTVDMFNEGVDVPAIDTVLMLRPTESPVVWMQQFGRGLRRAEGKDRLAVIDYIGSHRSFLTKARALLQAPAGERALAERLALVRRGDLALPPGCEVTYDLEALDILERLIRRTADADELDAFYRDMRERTGRRPTALDAFHAGFDPKRTGHLGWFGLVAHHGDLSSAEAAVAGAQGALVREIESTAMTRAYKMLVLRAMIDEGAFPGEIPVTQLAHRVGRLAARAPLLRREISADPDDAPSVARLLGRYALPLLAEADGGLWFAVEGDVFKTRFSLDPAAGAALARLVSELVDWRLAQHLAGRQPEGSYPEPGEAEKAEAAEPVVLFGAAPELWREYKREDIPALFGATFNTGAWNQGMVAVEAAKAMVLMVTLKKGALSAGNHYDDRFIDEQTFAWHTQTQTKREGRHGRIVSGREPGWTVHLFVRTGKLRNGVSAPFRYCGGLTFVSWEGEAPIAVTSRLAAAVPLHLRQVMGIA